MTPSRREDGAPPRQVDVFDLARRGATVDGDAPVAAFERVVPSLARASGSVRFAFHGMRDDRGRPAASLWFAADVELLCDRCGRILPWRLEATSRFWFVQTEDELAALPVDEAEDEPLLGSARFDLAALLEDELLLALPMSPRHPGCRSGWPAAAPDAVPSVARGTDRPRPFAALAGLKVRRS